MAPPTMTTHHTTSQYMSSPIDNMDRLEYGIQKSRKVSSTGGGRAWSEDEEVYLLQTRLQKMPYKHIATHLKKTELACRLHYHQLSHGSNRRKRTTSVCSSPSQQSPNISMMSSSRLPSPVNEHGIPASYGYSPINGHSQLHHLPPVSSSLVQRSVSPSQRLPSLSIPVAILPKPIEQARRAEILRLDCNVSTPQYSSPHSANPIDRARLAHIYESHRADFWNRVASDYSTGLSSSVAPEALEQAYFAHSSDVRSSTHSVQSHAPPTPCATPVCGADNTFGRSGSQERSTGVISVSALLGIDASPRSPKERELIRLMEETRRATISV